MLRHFKSDTRVDPANALPGRDHAIPVPSRHAVLGTPLSPPFAENTSRVILGMGCFWGAERLFWKMPGVYTTAVGYAGGYTPNPSYEEVCSGLTGHTEVVLVIYHPSELKLQTLLETFWQAHDPTQGMRQGNDRGSQYRSAIYTDNTRDTQLAGDSLSHYQQQLDQAGLAKITTEVSQDVDFYYAEAYHQQYLHHNPNGYCGLKGSGVAY